MTLHKTQKLYKNIINIFTSSVRTRKMKKWKKRKTQLNEMKKVLISTPTHAKFVTQKKQALNEVPEGDKK